MLGLSCSTIPMKFSLDNLTITLSFTIGYTLFIKCNSGVLYPCLIWFLYWLRCMKFFLWATLFFPSDTNLGQIRSVVFLSVQLSNTDAKSDLVVHKCIHHTRGRKVKCCSDISLLSPPNYSCDHYTRGSKEACIAWALRYLSLCLSLCLSLSPKLERVLRHCIDEQPGALLDIN